MKKKMFLTSAVAMGFVSPAVAAMTDSNTFPDGGLMQANTRYIGAATADNMDSVYEGSVNATAEYETLNYLLSAGQYLPADSETPTTCPVGSFCSGIGSVQYDEENDQGLTSCPTIDDATFTSVAGSSAVTACYQEDSAMSTATLNPFTTAHLNTSKNTDGYINGVKYASATTTARRYATTATTAGNWAALDESDLAITDLACVNGWHFKAGVNGSAIATAIGQVGGTSNAYIENGGSFHENSASYGATHYGLTNNNTWAVDYGDKGMLIGQARCSTRAGASDSDTWAQGTYHSIADNFVSSLTDQTGKTGAKYCYCNVTGYTPDGGTLQSLSSPWVYYNDDYSTALCAYECASFCADVMRYTDSGSLSIRAAMFNSVQSTPAICEANTITINWSNASATDIATNNAGTATYGSDVRTPVKAETIKGKTFKGWKFSKPTQTTTGGSN